MRNAKRGLATAAVLVMLTAGCSTTSTGSPSSTASLSPTVGQDTSVLVDTTSGLVRPGSVHVSPGEPVDQARRVVGVAQRLYTFWNTGNAAYLDGTVDSTFVDNTLPDGRPQGPTGPPTASQGFRAAVPDLTCELADLYVVGDTFTARLVFRGHFTGTKNGIQGTGQQIDFNAIDIQHLGNGSTITEDWHLEDNLTFLQQAGLVTIAGTS